MPTLANIVVQDHVPASRTYIPTARTGGVTQWEERSSAYALGYCIFQHSIKTANANRKGTTGINKHSYTLNVPVVSTADPNAPKVSHFIPLRLEANSSDASTEAERAAAYDMFRNLLNNSSVRESFVKNVQWFG